MIPRSSLGWLLVCLACSAPVFAQDDPAEAAPSGDERRAALEALEGRWSVVTTAWMDPESEPVVIESTMVKSWVLHGRYLEERVEGTGPGGEAFEGLGYLGWDAAREAYEGVWLSSLGAHVITYRGQEESPGSFVFSGSEAGPTGHRLEFRIELEVSADEHTLSLTYLLPDGSESRAFEMIHTRIEEAASAPSQRDVARTVLTRYRAQDLVGLAELCTAGNRRIVEEIAAQGEAHPRWASLWRGWRWEAIQAWDGQLGEVRVLETSGHRQARVVFGQGEGEVFVVSLDWEQGRWAFQDINSPSAEDFAVWGAAE